MTPLMYKLCQEINVLITKILILKRLIGSGYVMLANTYLYPGAIKKP